MNLGRSKFETKWYQVLIRDNTNRNPFVADKWDIGDFTESDFTVGQKITNWSVNAWLRAATPESDGEPDDSLLNDLLIPIYSERFRQALNTAGISGIQYLPVEVLRPNGDPIKGYSIANVVNSVDALDMTQSMIDYYPDDWPIEAERGKLSVVMKAVLRASQLDRVDILRLKNAPDPLYVSERFQRVFSDNNFTGMGFTKVRVSS